MDILKDYRDIERDDSPDFNWRETSSNYYYPWGLVDNLTEILYENDINGNPSSCTFVPLSLDSKIGFFRLSILIDNAGALDLETCNYTPEEVEDFKAEIESLVQYPHTTDDELCYWCIGIDIVDFKDNHIANLEYTYDWFSNSWKKGESSNPEEQKELYKHRLAEYLASGINKELGDINYDSVTAIGSYSPEENAFKYDIKAKLPDNDVYDGETLKRALNNLTISVVPKFEFNITLQSRNECPKKHTLVYTCSEQKWQLKIN